MPSFKDDLGGIIAFARRLPENNVGISDPAIALHAAFYHLMIPDAKVVIVRRAQQHSVLATAEAFNMPLKMAADVVQRCADGLDVVRSKFKSVHEVEFEKLSNMETLRELWNFCCPLETFNDTRVKFLTRMKCEVLL